MDVGISVPAIEHVFAHTDDLVIVTTGCEAHPGGISFRLLVLSKQPIDFVTEFAFGIDQRRHAGSLDLSASATLRNGSQQPIILGVFGGDSATRARADFRFSVPLPEDADTAHVRLTWPTRKVDEAAHIDVRLFRPEFARAEGTLGLDPQELSLAGDDNMHGDSTRQL